MHNYAEAIKITLSFEWIIWVDHYPSDAYVREMSMNSGTLSPISPLNRPEPPKESTERSSLKESAWTPRGQFELVDEPVDLDGALEVKVII